MLDFLRQKIPVAPIQPLGYSAVMEKRGTIADITKWAEASLPGEESRARSVIVGCRKADLFTKGGHGRNAPFMMLTDFPTAILAVLHPGQVTQVHEAVKGYWSLPLSLINLETRDDGSASFDPTDKHFLKSADLIRPFCDQFGFEPSSLSEPGTDSLIGFLTNIFANHAPKQDFSRFDFIEMETALDSVSVRIVLHGPNWWTASGFMGTGISACSIGLVFGDLVVGNGRAIKTVRRLGADALNELAFMTPNYVARAD